MTIYMQNHLSCLHSSLRESSCFFFCQLFFFYFSLWKRKMSPQYSNASGVVINLWQWKQPVVRFPAVLCCRHFLFLCCLSRVSGVDFSQDTSGSVNPLDGMSQDHHDFFLRRHQIAWLIDRRFFTSPVHHRRWSQTSGSIKPHQLSW